MNEHASDGAVTTTVSALSDDRLLAQAKELSGAEVEDAASRNFGNEGGRRDRRRWDRTRYPGGGQARGLAARPGPL